MFFSCWLDGVGECVPAFSMHYNLMDLVLFSSAYVSLFSAIQFIRNVLSYRKIVLQSNYPQNRWFRWWKVPKNTLIQSRSHNFEFTIATKLHGAVAQRKAKKFFKKRALEAGHLFCITTKPLICSSLKIEHAKERILLQKWIDCLHSSNFTSKMQTRINAVRIECVFFCCAFTYVWHFWLYVQV